MAVVFHILYGDDDGAPRETGQILCELQGSLDAAQAHRWEVVRQNQDIFHGMVRQSPPLVDLDARLRCDSPGIRCRQWNPVIGKMFDEHIPVRIEVLPSAQRHREIKLTLPGYFFIDVKDQSVRKLDVFEMAYGGDVSHDIENMIDALCAGVYLVQILKVINEVHDYSNSIRPYGINHLYIDLGRSHYS